MKKMCTCITNKNRSYFHIRAKICRELTGRVKNTVGWNCCNRITLAVQKHKVATSIIIIVSIFNWNLHRYIICLLRNFKKYLGSAKSLAFVYWRH